jgi:hypothetical protein
LLNSKRFQKSARGIIVKLLKKESKMTFEWKHPKYYQELAKIRKQIEKEEEEERDQEKENSEED